MEAPPIVTPVGMSVDTDGTPEPFVTRTPETVAANVARALPV